MPNDRWHDDDWRSDTRRDWRDERAPEARGDDWRGGREAWEDRHRGYGPDFDQRTGRNASSQSPDLNRGYGYRGGAVNPRIESERDLYEGSRYGEDWAARPRGGSFRQDASRDEFGDGRPGHRPDTYEDDRMAEHGYRSGSWTGNYGDHRRGFLDRASDEVSSWFGDDQAARRRRMDEERGHSGRGPKGYARSDDRIRDDVNDRLTYDRHVDASDIEVSVAGGEVTLNGTVQDRFSKRHAEDIVEGLNGVTHVQNNLRVKATTSADQTGVGATLRPETGVSAPYVGNAVTQEPGSPFNRNH